MNGFYTSEDKKDISFLSRVVQPALNIHSQICKTA